MSEPQITSSRFNAALIVSLCVNLLLAGVIAMAVLRFFWHQPNFDHGQPEPPAGAAERMQVRQLLSPRTLMHIAPAHSDQIHDVIHSHRDRIDALRRDAVSARRDVMRIFTAPNFDKASFDNALSRMQAADIALESEILKVASESAALLTPEERRKAAEMRSHGPDRMGGWRRNNSGPFDGAPQPSPSGPPPAPAPD